MRCLYQNFDRCGIVAKPVDADSGAIGGSGSAEFMVKSEIGEDDVLFCTNCELCKYGKGTINSEKAEKEEFKELNKLKHQM